MIGQLRPIRHCSRRASWTLKSSALHVLRDFCGLDGDTCGRQMVFIELRAGSAFLSAAAQRHGYRVLPVDCKRNRHKPRCHIVSLDLAEDHAWEVLEYIVSTCCSSAFGASLWYLQ